MTDAVFDFKSIKRVLDRQEQKAEFEAKNPPACWAATLDQQEELRRAISDWLAMTGEKFELPDLRGRVVAGVETGACEVGRLTGGSCESVTLTMAQLPPYTPTVLANYKVKI